MPFETANHICRDEGHHITGGRFHHIMAESGESHATGPTLIDQRGNPGMNPDHIRVQPERATDMLENMGVGIDHARNDETPGDIDILRSRQFTAERRNLAARNGDIHHAIDPLCRINHPAAL